MNDNNWSASNANVPLTELFWEHLLPWFYGKLFTLGWTFVSSLVSYSPFLLMALIENKIEEHRVKAIHQAQIRVREDYAMKELSAYKEGDEINEYIKPEARTQEEESNKEDEDSEGEDDESRKTKRS